MTRGHAAFSGLFLTSTWPVLVLAFLAGLFSATALPPWSFPLGIFGFSVLFVLIYQTKTIKIDDVGSEINKILKGDQIGRVVIQHGE